MKKFFSQIVRSHVVNNLIIPPKSLKNNSRDYRTLTKPDRHIALTHVNTLVNRYLTPRADHARALSTSPTEAPPSPLTSLRTPSASPLIRSMPSPSVASTKSPAEEPSLLRKAYWAWDEAHYHSCHRLSHFTSPRSPTVCRVSGLSPSPDR